MRDVVIWHNPRCTKSRQALALLKEQGITPEERRYLEDVPDGDEIRAALKALDVAPIDMMRKGEARFKELGLSANSDDETLITAMAANPRLIERPIVFAGGKARIGRPPENVLELF